MKESRVEGHLVKRVTAAGGSVRKCVWLGRRGAPDRVVLWPGHLDWVELKRPLTPVAEDHQLREHKRLRASGQAVYVLASIEEVDGYVDRHRKPGEIF